MKQPKYVQAGKMREAGASYDEIAKEFGWTKKTAKLNAWRYRSQDKFLAYQRQYQAERRAEEKRETGK